MTSPNVTQAMIDAYYEYTHLTLDRGKFVSKLRTLAEPESSVKIMNPLDFLAAERERSAAKLPQ